MQGYPGHPFTVSGPLLYSTAFQRKLFSRACHLFQHIRSTFGYIFFSPVSLVCEDLEENLPDLGEVQGRGFGEVETKVACAVVTSAAIE